MSTLKPSYYVPERRLTIMDDPETGRTYEIPDHIKEYMTPHLAKEDKVALLSKRVKQLEEKMERQEKEFARIVQQLVEKLDA